jgi:hypothetical protein
MLAMSKAGGEFLKNPAVRMPVFLVRGGVTKFLR